jgi:putative spermidine/putrescine transport system substrate-binding protein
MAEAAGTDTFVVEGNVGSWGEMEQKTFLRPFATEHPDVKFVWSGEADDGVVISKILLSCGNPGFAVADVNTNVGPIVLGRGCVAGYDSNLMPNLKYVAKEAVLEAPGVGPYFASSSLAILGLVWNTKAAKKPSSWEDLWDPRYKGKVGVPDFVWTGQDWLPAVSKLHGGNEDNVGPGIEAISTLVKKNQATILHSTDQTLKLFESGAIVMAPFWNGRTFALQRKGVPVAIEFVQNCVFVGDGYIIMKGTRMLELAQRYVNVTIDGQKALGMTAVTGYPPSDTRVKLPPEFEPARVTAESLSKVVPIDWAKIAQHRDEYLRMWNEKVKA